MAAVPISTVMTHDVHHVPPEAGLERIADLEAATELVHSRGFRRLP